MTDAELALLFAFLNSHNLEGAPDWLVPAHYPEWVERRASAAVLDVPDTVREPLQAEMRALAGDIAHVDVAALGHARDVRDGLLALLLDGGDGVRDGTPAHELDELAAGIPLRIRVAPGGRVGLEPALRGPLAIAGRALILAHDAAVDGTWDRISLCRAEGCHWAFVDRSKNQSRVWCSMGDCGARAKARAYRERRRRQEP